LKSIGVANELARIVLPLNLYTQFYMTVNARSLMNFLTLRCADDAQWEIRQYAIAMRGIFAEKMPMTAEAYEEFGYAG
jgi:thymidylate synthase (FAD)